MVLIATIYLAISFKGGVLGCFQFLLLQQSLSGQLCDSLLLLPSGTYLEEEFLGITVGIAKTLLYREHFFPLKGNRLHMYQQ